MRAVAVLASGEGTNLQALIDAARDGRIAARFAGVFSDRRGARALERARDAGIPAQAFAPKAFADRAAFDAALFGAVAASGADLVVCAGYMRLLDAAALAPWQGRIVNIHPSLLPAYKGLHTHARALDDGAAVHGASVHFVTGELDGGPVIAQAAVPVLPGDDAAALAARVRGREHPLLVAVVGLLCEGRAVLDERGIQFDGAPLDTPLQLGATDRFP